MMDVGCFLLVTRNIIFYWCLFFEKVDFDDETKLMTTRED
jgi:hypothetical protein